MINIKWEMINDPVASTPVRSRFLTLARLCYLSVPRVKLSYQVLQLSRWFRSSRHVQKTFQVPHTPIEQFALDNGLRVVLNEDHSVPVVSVAVYYDVGSRNER